MNIQIFKTNLEKLTGETKQNKIADILNVSVSKVSKWFSGTLLPTISDLLNISNTYCCSIDWLIGNGADFKNTMSVYSICKFLIALDDELLMHMELKEMTEEVSFWDDEKETFIEKKYRKNIPIIYMHNTESANQIIDKIENNFNWASCHYVENFAVSVQRTYGSILNCNKEINDFLIKYIQLKDVLHKELISETVFDDVINSYLDKLSKKDIDYFPYSCLQSFRNDIDEDEDEDGPFDGPPCKFSEEVIKMLEESQKEGYKIENVLYHFASQNKISFLEESTDTNGK